MPNRSHNDTEVEPTVGTGLDKASCLNCASALHGLYCHTCRQRADTGRYTFRGMVGKMTSTVFNVDRGILQNVVGLKDPRRTVMRFLAGQRVRYFDPLLYCFISLGVILFIEESSGTILQLQMNMAFQTGRFNTPLYDAGPFINEWLKYIFFSFVFILALPNSWLFRERRGLYAEHVIATAFILGWTNTLYLGLIWLPWATNYPLNILCGLIVTSLTFLVYFEGRYWLTGLKTLASITLSLMLIVLSIFLLWAIGLGIHLVAEV